MRKYSGTRLAAKGKGRSGGKLNGDATFASPKRRRVARAKVSYIEPVAVADAASMDTGSTELSVPCYGSRPAIPVDDLPWVYREQERVMVDEWGTERVVTHVVDRPERGYSHCALYGREMDTRSLGWRYEPGKSEKHLIGKKVRRG